MITQVQFGNIFTSGDKTVLGGSNTGFDTEALINGLVEAKRLPAVQLESRLEQNSLKLGAFNELSSTLSTFRESLDFLRNPPGVNNANTNIFEYRAGSVRSNTSTLGSNYLNVTAEPGAEIGEYDITIDQVATANIKTTETFALENADTDAVGIGKPFNAGTLTLGPNNVDVVIEEDDSLNQIVSKINAVSSTSQVRATVLKISDGNYRLQFRTTETGTDMNYDLLGGAHAQVGNELVIEAEDYVSNISRSGDTFVTVDDGTASGGQYIEAQINDGTTIGASIETTSPEVIYNVDFASTGTYYVHTLARGNASDDSFHLGLDGTVQAGSTGIKAEGDPNFTWNENRLGNIPAEITVSTTGVQSLNLYMREDGADIDTIVLTTDPAYDPNVTPPSGSTLPNDNTSIFNVALASEVDAVDAELTIDGTTITRNTNTINDLIEDVTFELLQETPDGTVLDVEVEPDLDIIRGGIISFIDGYNAFRLYEAQQTERDSASQPVESAILVNNASLRVLNGSILTEINSIVNGIDSEPNRLADLGITLTDFPGDDENPAATNILVLDQTKLDVALASDFSAVRSVFEFDFSSSSNDIQVFSRTNAIDVTDFSLNLDFTNESYQASYIDSNGDTQMIDVDIIDINGGGYTVSGQSGTVLEGLKLIYSGTEDTIANISITQGIGDRLFNVTQRALEEDSGIIASEVESINTSNERFNQEITRIDEVVERFRQQQLQRFSALEAAIASINTLLQSLDAQATAQSNA